MLFGNKQTPEETEKCLNNLNMIKQRFKLEAIPQVIVLDKNQDVVINEASNDLMELHPEACRQIWIEILNDRIVQMNNTRMNRS